MCLIHNQAISSSTNTSPKRTPIGTSTNNFSWTVWYFGCDGVEHRLLGAKIQVLYIWRIRSHLPGHMYHHLCCTASQQMTLLLLYYQVIRYLQKEIWISCSWHQYHGMIQLHNDYSHSTGSVYMTWVPASSCHPFKWEISRDKSNDLTASYSLRNIERRVIWFEGVLFIAKYRNTIQMIWMCPNH